MPMPLPAPSRKQKILSDLLTCLAACGCTLLALAVVYAARGVWPFGADNVAYVDTAQFYVPRYYQIWDAMHGLVSSHLNWFAGLAEAGNAYWQVFLYPYSWAFLLVPRDHVLEGLSLYLAIHLVIIAAMTCLVLCRRFPRIGRTWKVTFTLLYTFSGFILQYYANFFWLPYAAVFPWLVYALERLLRDGKYMLYLVIYLHYLYDSVYCTYMVTIFVLLFSLGYCFMLLPREKRGERILRLGLSTAAAYIIGARFWIPSSQALASTSRFESNMDSGLMTGMTTWNIPNTRHTALMLLGMALTLALLIDGLLRQRKVASEARPARRRVIWFFVYMAAVFAVPMVFTNIDTVWHFGQYNFFPMRYGYMLPAILIAGACLSLDERTAMADSVPAENKARRWVKIAVIVAALAGVAVMLPRVEAIFVEYGSAFLTAMGTANYFRYFAMLVGCGVLFTALYFGLLRLKNRRAAAWAVAAVAFLQVGANAYGLIAPSDDHTYTREYDPAYIETADDLYAYFSQQDISPLSRAKNVDNSLNAGYPAIAGISALSTMASGNSSTRLGVFRELGYTVNYFRILDTGGTVFSDMILGVNYILSAWPLDETLYLPGETVDGIQIGTARYPGVFGLMYDDEALMDYLDYETMPDRLNALYRAFTDSQETLAYAVEPAVTVDGEGLKTYTLTCDLAAPGFLYLASDGMMMNITANGQDIAVPSYLNLDNTVYPATFNSNLLYMGLYDGPVEIGFSSAADLGPEDFTVLTLDKGLLDSFYDDANLDADAVLETFDNGFTFTVTADRAGRRLFVPIAYGGCPWRCTVNGEAVNTSWPMGVLTSIPLQEGENVVSLVSQPPFTAYFPQLLLTYAALALVWFVLRRVFPGLWRITPPKAVCALALAAFVAVTAAVICLVYIAPTVLLISRGTIVWF